MSPPSSPVGFVGLGNMGRPMAERILAAGFSLIVHDLRQEQAAPLLEQGAEWAESLADLAARSKVICTSLPGPDEFEAVFSSADGLLAGIQQDSICIDFTTNSPLLIRSMSDRLDQLGAVLLDAPVSGGVEGAAAGRLTILVSGPAPARETVQPILDILAQKTIPLGETGQASICKVLHNCAVLAANLATVECLTAGVKAGVDAKTLVDVFQSSGLGRNLDLQVAMPATLFRGQFEPRFALKTAYKDIRLAIELAQACNVPMELSESCHRELQAAMERGWGDQDNTIFLKLQEERAGACIRTENPQ